MVSIIKMIIKLCLFGLATATKLQGYVRPDFQCEGKLIRYFKRDKDSNSKMLFKIPEDHRHAMLEEAPEVTIHDAREL